MDVLSDEDWSTICKMILEVSSPFHSAIGIPRGGVKLGELLNEHATGKEEDPICIVDDVLTTGKSMEHFLSLRGIEGKRVMPAIGWVVFARNKPPHWCKALFQMPIQNGWKTIGGPGYNYK